MHARTHTHGANYNLPPASRAGDNNTHADEGTEYEENTEFFVDMVKRGENSLDTAFIKLKLANKSVSFNIGHWS